MIDLKEKFRSTTFRYGVLFILTGFLILLYSKMIFLNVPNVNLGKRFSTGEFYESDFFNLIAMLQIIVGIIYLVIEFKAIFYLIDRKTILNYWFVNSFILVILSVPILNKYYPTDGYGGTKISQLIMVYIFVSLILFFVGIYHYLTNVIKSVYSYFVIKKGWKN